MSKGSKVVFVAFTQHYIQSNFTHLTHVKRVKRSFNSFLLLLMLLMSKGLKVVFVAYIHNIDTIDAMSKGSKDDVMLKQREKHIFDHNFLNIQPIFNPKKSFGQLRLRPFQPYHPVYHNHIILCMLKWSKVI